MSTTSDTASPVISQAASVGDGAKHTPTPWRVDPGKSLRVFAGKDDSVASVGLQSNLRDQWEANAALIVKAVNAMPDVRFLLDRLAEFDPGDYEAERDFHGHVAPAIARLRNAIA